MRASKLPELLEYESAIAILEVLLLLAVFVSDKIGKPIILV
jgi:hypothetical protein